MHCDLIVFRAEVLQRSLGKIIAKVSSAFTFVSNYLRKLRCASALKKIKCESNVAFLPSQNINCESCFGFYLHNELIVKVALVHSKNLIAVVALRFKNFKKCCVFLRCASVYLENMPTSGFSDIHIALLPSHFLQAHQLGDIRTYSCRHLIDVEDKDNRDCEPSA